MEARAEEATARIFAEVPAYQSADAPSRSDVRAHVLSHLRAGSSRIAGSRCRRARSARSRSAVIRGGYYVYPLEIEEVLDEHPAVGAAAVVGRG